jgi:outer membrane protein assembly factor BamB
MLHRPHRPRFARIAPLTIACFVLSASGPAQEWTRFRGPNGSGVSAAQIPTTWTDADLNWKARLPGIGHSSPVVWQDRVFLMSADPETATQFVIAIDTQDGRIVWQRDFAITTYPLHLRNSFASTTPAVDTDHVYVAWATPDEATLMALNHDGETVWRQSLGSFASQHGFGSSPIVYEDLVLLAILEKKPDGISQRVDSSRIVALERRSGELRWTQSRGSDVASYSVPCIYRSPTGIDQLIGCSTADGIFSLDPRSGAVNWQFPAFDMRTVSSPIVADGLVFGTTGSGAGGNYVVAVQPGQVPQRAYDVRQQAPYVPTPIAKDGRVFLWSDKGMVSCIRAISGELIWRQRVGGDFSGSPVIAGDCLYCIDEEGVVVVLAATDKAQELGRIPLGEPSRSTPAIAGNRMYLRTYSHLISVGSKREGS